MKTGDTIPTLLGVNAQGQEVKSTDFAGKPLIIYFYPKDNTPGCTAEACSLRDGYDSLRNLGYEVIGVSKDSSASHAKFAEKYSLPFTLISDPSTELNQAFGVWQKKKMAGREYMGTVRTTFITDADHRVTHIINKVDTKNAAAQIMKLLAESQQS
ncbi:MULTISPECIES: thioredoxin-dependent thiol peroxidase [Muribaculum]|uniref:thioredoxin-dependent peroxiredoxin n=4 Tax=Muribaculum TaxID=1918540 RepID=A0A4P7VQW4_9BACT|nr:MULTISPECIES: thioredoxin-dependent thiol peroxidase [Muribaculum]MCX4278408.1 thioredoxin-dependent thiol peroxidase [Muribaculum sp.]QCD36590.1 thioredoxin-dependent thiol peroxidase [Muribaculum gordoncarteri]TGY03974.1 thioredoxin-dependent thiol peroxidase [Muribaculum sp. NM65_B17]THG43365.1 thioredoxin-dependent thiol peroxidase [Muribaculaceae bacterium]